MIYGGLEKKIFESPLGSVDLCAKQRTEFSKRILSEILVPEEL